MQNLNKGAKQNFGKFQEGDEEVEFVEDNIPGPGHYFQNSTANSSQSQMFNYKKDFPSAFGS